MGPDRSVVQFTIDICEEVGLQDWVFGPGWTLLMVESAVPDPVALVYELPESFDIRPVTKFNFVYGEVHNSGWGGCTIALLPCS